MWTWEGAGTGPPLRSVQFPNFRDLFDAVAPEEVREYSPPFLGALQEPGLVQRRQRARRAHAAGREQPRARALRYRPQAGTYELFEGVIETDHWFGPLITNMRLTKTDVPIDFRADFPLLQVQPLPRHAYEDSTLNNYELVPDLKQLTPEDWDEDYGTPSYARMCRRCGRAGSMPPPRANVAPQNPGHEDGHELTL